ncbi:hypothetical protein [Streptomyces sp. AS02]|uniref:DUF6891 domain-containing protein n=1 Tax=Streptomyces sp. AS02 TaxID=2938946 RepID=UPI0020208ECE|nr:hypothetical protein [Streptomyces sp. AS02]MCL8010409.1 hypothetical protein [Streptomyces sp. AS02]
MEIDEVLAVKVETENGETHTWPSVDRLRELVNRIGDRGDQFLVVQRIPDIPDVFAQVWHGGGRDYRFEHRESRDRFFGTTLTAPHLAADAMVGWARQADGWDAAIAWAPVDVDPPQEVPELPGEVREELEELVRGLLRCGYDDRATLAQDAEEYLVEGDERPVSGAQARQLVDRLWLERLDQQEGWSAPTDPDRLTTAFAALDRAGIVARENFTCCRSCGMSEIGAEAADHGSARGFVFFHAQCTSSAADGHGLTLYYGGFDGSEETTGGVGHEVVAALGAAGLPTDWDGSPAQAITVTPLDWRKRLQG